MIPQPGRQNVPLMLVALTLGCTPATHDTSDTYDTGLPSQPCDVDVFEFTSVPQTGTADVFYRSEIFIEISTAKRAEPEDLPAFNEQLLSATLWKQAPDGSYAHVDATEVVELQPEAFSPTWRIVPEHSLEPATTYQARYAWCDDETTITFQTGQAGTPVSDDIIDGAVYTWKLDEADFGSVSINDQFGELAREVLVQIDLEQGEPNFTFAWSGELTSEQDLCAETTGAPGWDYDNPWFEGGALLPHWEPDDLPFGAIEVRGAFGPDPSHLYGLEFHILSPCASTDSPEDDCIRCLPPLETAAEGCTSFQPLTIVAERRTNSIIPRTTDQIASDSACSP